MNKTIQAIRDVQIFGEEGGVVPVIDHAAASTFLNPDDMERVFSGELQGCYLYSRHSNPTVTAFSKKMAAMENTEAAFGVASGMAAITCAVEQIMQNEGHIISSNTIYGGTYALFVNILQKRGIEITFVDPLDVSAFEKAIRPNTKMIYTETMSNPLLGVGDLEAIGKLCKKHSIKLVVDNTFTPLMVTPSNLGADVVIHSCTKYISGASDMIAGVICSSLKFINELIDVNSGFAMIYGPVMDPRVAYELYSRLDHLHVRLQGHSKAAEVLVKKLKDEGIKGVTYSGSPDHPNFSVIKRLFNTDFGYGGMVTIDCKTLENASRLAAKLQNEKFGLFAVSLGYSRTLMSCPSASTSSEIPLEDQEKIGLKRGLLRLSIGFSGDSEYLAEKFVKAYREIIKT